MMTSRSEYLFVSTDQPLIIDGGIMPKRKKDPQVQTAFGPVDADRILRAEDISFCLETCHQHATIAQASRPSKTSVDKVILSSDWRTVCNSIRTRVQRYGILPTYNFSTKLIGSYPNENLPISTYYPNCQFDASTLKSDASKFFMGSKLERQPIMDVFHDLNACRRFWFQKSGLKRPSDQYDTYESGDYIIPTSADGYVLYSHTAIRFGTKHSTYPNKTGTSTSTMGSPLYFGLIADKYGRCVSNDGVKMIIPMMMSVVEYVNNRTERLDTGYGFFVLDGRVSGDGIYSPMIYATIRAQFMTLVNQFCVPKDGGSLPKPDDYDRSSQEISAQYLGWAYIVNTAGTRTDFSQYM